MSENKFKIGKVSYKAVPAENGCRGCAFEKDQLACEMTLSCSDWQRSDKRSVIFVEDIQTNGDRIRSSTNRDLAKLAGPIFISEIEKFSGCKIPEYLKKAQARAIKKWLDSPVKKEKNW